MGITITEYGNQGFNTEVQTPSVPLPTSILVTSIRQNEIDFTTSVQGQTIQLIVKGFFDVGLINLLPTTLDDIINSGLSTNVTNGLVQFSGQPAFSLALNPGLKINDFYNLLKGGSLANFSPLNGNDIYITNNTAENNVFYLYDGNDILYQNHLLAQYNDLFYGGDGSDKIIFQGKSSDFNITYTTKGIWDDLNQKTGLEGFTIKDNKNIINTTQINQVENIQFSDKTIDLTPFMLSAQQSVTLTFFGTHNLSTYYDPNNSGAPPYNQVKVTSFTNTEIDASVSFGTSSLSIDLKGLFDTSIFKTLPATFADIQNVVQNNQPSTFLITGLSLSAPNDPIRNETYSKALTFSQFGTWVNPTSNSDYSNFLSGNDVFITSNNGDDSDSSTIYGYAGNDTFYENQKLIKYNDIFYGGDGTDTVIYSGKTTNYTIIYSNSIWDLNTQKNNLTGFTITDHGKQINTLQINQVEKIQFSDLTLDTTMFTKTAALSSNQIVSLVELYIASFNRAPDSVGLDYWGSRLSDGMSLQDIAKSFFVQPETVAAYPTTMATSDFVTKVYNNVLSRGPDKGGLDYWVGELNTGHVTKDSFLLAIINGAMAATGSAVDRQTLANKESVGAYYALTQGLNNSTTWAKDVMSAVTDQMTTVTAANAKIDGYAAIAANPTTSDLVVKLVGVVA